MSKECFSKFFFFIVFFIKLQNYVNAEFLYIYIYSNIYIYIYMGVTKMGQTFLDKNMLVCTCHKFFCKFHMVYTSQAPKI